MHRKQRTIRIPKACKGVGLEKNKKLCLEKFHYQKD